MESNPRNVSPLCHSDVISEKSVPNSTRYWHMVMTRRRTKDNARCSRLRLPEHAEQGKPALVAPKVLRGLNSEVKFREDSDL